MEQAKTYIEQQLSVLMPSYDIAEIHFMGGEPLMEFDTIKSIAEWLWGSEIGKNVDRMFASTNGTLLTEKMKEWFRSNKHRIVLGLSFDGNCIMQDRNRSHSYGLVDLGFFAKTWPDQSVKMTLTPETLPHFFEGVMSLRKQGFKYITPDLAMGKNVCWSKEDARTYAEQLDLFVDFYLSNPQERVISLLDIDFSAVATKAKGKKCGCGENLVCIDTDGAEYACHLFAPISSSPTVAHKSQRIDFTNHAQFISDMCSGCALVNICNQCCGMNYTSSGNVSSQDPFVCHSFRIQFLAACRLWYTKAVAEHDENTRMKLIDIFRNIKIENYGYNRDFEAN